ncbi:penicillin-binding transpeptidase domain-containing protein [Algoriphagus halophytocola]|uniref:Penicillin-binding transpeptidase domain-containing protein n=1 Tax=Algoriphagus halophytocola TaxID=2991499 RepID=A0ABY6MBT6_9BACT|nr:MULTISPECIES: penicillin-binding transpeptidase domain-containing protein [unclassified Algoriphagus]UZD21077.1 penicillin-binding transpeptidase domain-containing protein [Algoriphagus sp. TR-M5]WBL42243.1 penicillin-binding transpeptidase domain-containing protein [Algoriphagus sp. TR-M9]
MNFKKSILIRVRVVFILIALGSALIPYQIAKLQLAEGDVWREKAETINFQFREVPATRGNIYASDGSLLATSLPFYRVALDPTIADKDDYNEGLDSLARLLSGFYKDRSAASYKRMINDARLDQKRYLVLNRKQIGYQAMQQMSTWPIFREGRLGGGVLFEKVEKRYRPFNSLASRTVGFLNEDNYGAGIEYSFNNYLKGQDGKALFQRLAGGSWKPVFDAEDVKPENGFDVITTLDVNIQDVAETALRRQLTDRDAEFGSVIVMEVKTGQIKAITNLQRNTSGNGYGENYNFAIGDQGSTEPGSTFKLLSMLALLEENKVTLDETVETGNGAHKFYNQVMRDAKNGGYGTLTIREAFEKSSNVGISKLVDEHFGSSPSKFMAYLDKVGLAEPFGFQLIGEGKPFFKKPGEKDWYGTSLPWISIGYESKLNPIHTLALYNAVANGGKMMKPYIVKSISKGNTVEKAYAPEVVRKQIASEKTVRELQALLEGVVSRGTARNIANSDYPIAGKTGTAQKLKNGKYTRNYYTSFAGYFPADRPKYSMIVVIDSPKGFAAYGGDVSAPVFKEIADRIYALDMELNPSSQREILKAEFADAKMPLVKAGKAEELQEIFHELGLSATPVNAEEWVQTVSNDTKMEMKVNDTDKAQVPDVSGMSLRDALFILENKGLKVNYSGKGRVKNQSISPGAELTPNATINLVLG